MLTSIFRSLKDKNCRTVVFSGTAGESSVQNPEVYELRCSHAAYGTKLLFPKALKLFFFWIETGSTLQKANHLSHSKPLQWSEAAALWMNLTHPSLLLNSLGSFASATLLELASEWMGKVHELLLWWFFRSHYGFLLGITGLCWFI